MTWTILLFLPPANEVWGKVMFLLLSICSRGCLSLGLLGECAPLGHPHGRQAGGTHPIGMLSCILYFFTIYRININ